MMHQFNTDLEKKYFRPYRTLFIYWSSQCCGSLHSINDVDCPSNKPEQNSVWAKQKPIRDQT
jgi:hypothetical protein